MGSACQKLDQQYPSQSKNQENIDFDEIEKEVHPKKVHKGFRKLLLKSSNKQKNEQNVQSILLQNNEIINIDQKSCVAKSTHEGSLQQEIQLKSIEILEQGFSAQQVSSKIIKSSLKTILHYNSKCMGKKSARRDHSEKQVRFKLPKNVNRKRRAQSQAQAKMRVDQSSFIQL